jgi:hypothetical protein
MSNQWSKIYNQKNFHRNLNSLKAVILAKKKSLSYKKLSFELFKIMNPQSNSSSLYKSFLDFMNFIKINTKIKASDILFDYGSGNGATLLYLVKKYKIKNYKSFDVNRYFVKVQKKILNPKNIKRIQPGNNINLKTNSVDWTISNAVLHCLDNKEQVKKLINQFINISKKGLFISDIFNPNYKDKFINYQRNRQNLSIKEYKKKYKKTPHLYFNKIFWNFLKKNNKIKKIKFINMPKSFYDSQFGRYAILIKLN